VIINNELYLSELDMIGDADFGINVSRAFRMILERLTQLSDPDIGTILRTAGNVFVFDIGATIGGYLGRSFQKAADEMQGKLALTATEFVDIFRIMLAYVKERGGAKVGDKTLIDALEPAVHAGNNAVASGVRDVREAIDKMARAADEGAKNTANLVSRVGRSSYIGKRSRGKMDPGAILISLLLDSMKDSASIA
jgi:dihydroxyacetone kinase-like protein